MSSLSTSVTNRLFDEEARKATLESIESTVKALRQAYRDPPSEGRKIADIRHSLLALKTRLNSFTYISAMPIEILEEIFSQTVICPHTERLPYFPFTCASCADLYSRGSPYIMRKTLSKVCSAWKMLLENSPRLWTQIPASRGRRRTAEALRLSSQLPLYVLMYVDRGLYDPDISEGLQECIRSVQCILENLHRIEDLTLEGWSSDLDSSLTKYTTSQAPLLRRLVIIACDEVETYEFPFILCHNCPSLKFLVLQNLEFSTIRPRMLPALVELHVAQSNFITNAASVDEMLSLLESLPLLHTVSFNIAQHTGAIWWSEGFRSERTIPLVLPHLRSLTLIECPVLLLPHLQLPSIIHTFVMDHELIPKETEQTFTSYARLMAAGEATFQAMRITSSIWPNLTFEAEGYPNARGEVRKLRFSFHNNRDTAHFMPRPALDLCEAVGSSRVHAFDVICDDDEEWSTGLTSKTDWLELMHMLPTVKVLRVEGEERGKALFDALADDALRSPPWGVMKLVLRPKLFLEWERGEHTRSEYDERVRSYVDALVGALSARNAHGLVFEELKINGEGWFVDEDFAPVVPLVHDLILFDGAWGGVDKPYHAEAGLADSVSGDEEEGSSSSQDDANDAGFMSESEETDDYDDNEQVQSGILELGAFESDSAEMQ